MHWDECDIVLVNSISYITSSKYVFPHTTHILSHTCSPYTLMSNNACTATEYTLILPLKGTENYAQIKTHPSTSSTEDLSRKHLHISITQFKDLAFRNQQPSKMITRGDGKHKVLAQTETGRISSRVLNMITLQDAYRLPKPNAALGSSFPP